MPRSTTLTTGTSGSITAPSTSQAWATSVAVPGRAPRSLAIRSPGRIGVGPLEELHLGEKNAQMLAVHAAAAAQVEVHRRLRHRQGGAGEDVGDLGLPGTGDFRRVRRYAGCGQTLFDLVGVGQLDGETPQLWDGREHALVAFLGTITQTLHPLAGAAQVVGDFLQALRSDTGDALVAGVGEGGQYME